MRPVPLFVELCAGTSALSLRLQQRKAKPPVSRMGSKSGYANAILRVLGLHAGQKAEHYLLCEPDAGCRLLLEAYRDRALALAAADIIRSWADEEPRALWERLRAEGPPVCPPADAREVARWAWVQGRAYQGAAWGSSFLPVAHPVNGTNGTSPACTARRLADQAPLPATITPDARTVDPREVARWATVQRLTIPQAQARGAGPSDFNGGKPQSLMGQARSIVERSGLPATIADDARPIEPGNLPPGTVVYADVPYQGTTGYAHLFSREEWLPVVRRWAEAGAVVCISEAEPIPELVADGWHAVEITGARVGQARTFSKQKCEWLTLNRPPAWTVPVQTGLFG